jgi:hypothetical protein
MYIYYRTIPLMFLDHDSFENAMHLTKQKKMKKINGFGHKSKRNKILR